MSGVKKKKKEERKNTKLTITGHGIDLTNRIYNGLAFQRGKKDNLIPHEDKKYKY